MGKLFSIVEKTPPGFIFNIPNKRQLLTGHIAIFVEKPEDAFVLLENFCNRVRGLVISVGDLFFHREIGPELWHLSVAPDSLPLLQQFARCYLDIMENANLKNQKRKTLIEELTYSNQFYTQTQTGYNKAMVRLQEMVKEAQRENEKREEIISQLNHEILERKKAQDEQLRLESRLHQSQKMEALGLMAGGVAHDLNNILSGVVGYPDILLLSLSETSELRKPLESIKESGRRAAEIVSDLLTITRSSANTNEIVNLNSIISQYLDSLEFQKLKDDHPDVTFQLDLEEDLCNFAGSVSHIRKCLMNLVVNGAEAIKDTGILTISSRSQDFVQDTVLGSQLLKAGSYIIVSVKDTGQGIASEHLSHIFEPFYSRKKMGGSGSGLGLTIVWNTVQDHGGIVWVDSQGDGMGTVFELYFPSTAVPLDKKQDEFSVQELHGKQETILVVDDEELLREIANHMLQKLGYRVVLMSSGESAIAYLQDNEVDLVILDMIMDPGMSGRKTYEKILQFRPGQKAIIASGFAEDEDVRQVLRLGASSYLRKPYTLKVLGRTVRDSLEAGGTGSS